MLQNNAINKFQENATAEVAQEVNVNVADEVTSDESINAVEGAAPNLKKMKNTIYTVAELAEMGKTIARLEANRDFNTKAVNDKKKSLLDKGQLVPAIMVEATDAIKAGLRVVEFDTNEEIKLEEADKYVVLLDGNHRYKAHKTLLETKKDVLLIPVESIQYDNENGYYVFVYDAEEKIINRKTVVVGLFDGSSYEVLEGLSEGDQIVRAPRMKMEDGMSVVPKG